MNKSGLEKEQSFDAPLSIHDMTVAYNRKPVLWDVDLDIPKSKLIAIIGPNGAGKSTLIKAAMDLVPKTSGVVNFFGKPFAKQRHLVSYVPQRESVDWDFPIDAIGVVAMGRYRKIGWCLPVRKKDRLAEYANRQISQLSGGQQQRVFLARALVQDASICLMDEPFASVDATTEQAIVKVLSDLKTEGKTVVVVHHDLQTVTEYFDHVIMLNMRVVAHGAVKEVFTEENLKKTYGGRLTLLSEAADRLARQGSSR